MIFVEKSYQFLELISITAHLELVRHCLTWLRRMSYHLSMMSDTFSRILHPLKVKKNHKKLSQEHILDFIEADDWSSSSQTWLRRSYHSFLLWHGKNKSRLHQSMKLPTKPLPTGGV